jgi:hypothetical protein
MAAHQVVVRSGPLWLNQGLLEELTDLKGGKSKKLTFF